jgi:transcription initiation factor TFIIIB Brf1 subunit/transcription initiation factor TFIIB
LESFIKLSYNVLNSGSISFLFFCDFLKYIASDYVNRISLQLNLPGNIKDRALHLVEEIDNPNGTSPIIKACCAVLLATEATGLHLARGKVAATMGVTTPALRQALVRLTN